MSDYKQTPNDLAQVIGDLRRRLETVERTVASSTGRQAGTTAVSTTAAVSGSTAVTHDLGVAPTIVLAVAQNSTNGLTNVSVDSITSSGFNVSIRYVDGVSRTASITVGWEAVV